MSYEIFELKKRAGHDGTKCTLHTCGQTIRRGAPLIRVLGSRQFYYFCSREHAEAWVKWVDENSKNKAPDGLFGILSRGMAR